VGRQRLLRMAALAAAVISLPLYAAYALSYSVTASETMLGAALGLGGLGVLVAARRLYFLAGAAPHAALFAALLAVPAAFSLGGSITLWILLISILLTYIVGYAVHRGADPDTVTSVFVSMMASLSVVMAYLVVSRYPLGVDLAALVFGDPLLASHVEAVEALAAAAVTLTLVLLTYREQVYLGVDVDAARLAGLRTWLYDLIFYTMLGIGLGLTIRSVGFVLEHVMILVPGALATYAPSSRDALLYAVSASLFAGAAGLALGVLLDVSPAGMAGLVLFLFYLAAYLASEK